MKKVERGESVVNQLVDNQMGAVIDSVAADVGDVHIPPTRDCEVV